MVRIRLSVAWFEFKRFIVLFPHRMQQRQRFREYEIGDWVCCCDNQHRQIADKEKPDLLIMWDGRHFDAFNCVEPILASGRCHTDYHWEHE